MHAVKCECGSSEQMVCVIEHSITCICFDIIWEQLQLQLCNLIDNNYQVMHETVVGFVFLCIHRFVSTYCTQLLWVIISYLSLSFSLCVYVCVCVSVSLSVCLCDCLYRFTSLYVLLSVCVCVYVCLSMSLSVCVCVCVSLRVCLSLCVIVCIKMCC